MPGSPPDLRGCGDRQGRDRARQFGPRPRRGAGGCLCPTGLARGLADDAEVVTASRRRRRGLRRPPQAPLGAWSYLAFRLTRTAAQVGATGPGSRCAVCALSAQVGHLAGGVGVSVLRSMWDRRGVFASRVARWLVCHPLLRTSKLVLVRTDAVTIDELERWVLAGAHWRVVDITSQRVVVDLCACTGEPVERAQSDDPAVIGYLRTAFSHADLS
jgi:hypothetical protein